jgi:hypothetical protein
MGIGNVGKWKRAEDELRKVCAENCEMLTNYVEM